MKESIREYIGHYKNLRYNFWDGLPKDENGNPEYIVTGSKDYQKYKCRNNFLNVLVGRMELTMDFFPLSPLERALIKDKIKRKEVIVAKIRYDFVKLDDEEKTKLLDKYMTEVSENSDEYNFFTSIISETKKHFGDKLKNIIRSNYADAIKKAEQLNINRNRFSVICSFKTKDFDKDNEVFSLFSNLLSADKDKIELAIDYLIPYYENRPPYRKKTMLTVLLGDASKKVDSDHRKKIQKISGKLSLRMRKSIFELLGFRKV